MFLLQQCWPAGFKNTGIAFYNPAIPKRLLMLRCSEHAIIANSLSRACLGKVKQSFVTLA